jgi:hypothetical protein
MFPDESGANDNPELIAAPPVSPGEAPRTGEQDGQGRPAGDMATPDQQEPLHDQDHITRLSAGTATKSDLVRAESSDGCEPPALSSEDRLLAELLGRGYSHEEAGRRIGRSAKTVQRKYSRPGFAEAVDQEREKYHSQLRPAFTQTAVTALDALVAVLDSGSVADKLKAADLALRYGLQFQSVDGQRELARRIGELENLVATMNNAEDDALGGVGE